MQKKRARNSISVARIMLDVTRDSWPVSREKTRFAAAGHTDALVAGAFMEMEEVWGWS